MVRTNNKGVLGARAQAGASTPWFWAIIAITPPTSLLIQGNCGIFIQFSSKREDFVSDGKVAVNSIPF